MIGQAWTLQLTEALVAGPPNGNAHACNDGHLQEKEGATSNPERGNDQSICYAATLDPASAMSDFVPLAVISSDCSTATIESPPIKPQEGPQRENRTRNNQSQHIAAAWRRNPPLTTSGRSQSFAPGLTTRPKAPILMLVSVDLHQDGWFRGSPDLLLERLTLWSCRNQRARGQHSSSHLKATIIVAHLASSSGGLRPCSAVLFA